MDTFGFVNAVATHQRLVDTLDHPAQPADHRCRKWAHAGSGDDETDYCENEEGRYALCRRHSCPDDQL
ncbi:hypothetical protein JG688_00009458 [Phytophthora aleatoria]|uniref:Uncharacterized protein n=1 Tax=Phytophthora aleatoria TaxID=2496075 RepID=A0A8J5IPC0_9STRA|nr:hypothetical protein JG688_00009458 [Phytophthora aleatoria]